MGYHTKVNGPDPLLEWMRSKELPVLTIITGKIIKAQLVNISRNCPKGKKQMKNLFLQLQLALTYIAKVLLQVRKTE